MRRQRSIRSRSVRTGIKGSAWSSVSQRRFEKLSTTWTSWPCRERYVAVGHPRYPSPPKIRIRMRSVSPFPQLSPESSTYGKSGQQRARSSEPGPSGSTVIYRAGQISRFGNRGFSMNRLKGRTSQARRNAGRLSPILAQFFIHRPPSARKLSSSAPLTGEIAVSTAKTRRNRPKAGGNS
jgi:hypothetical protein